MCGCPLRIPPLEGRISIICREESSSSRKFNTTTTTTEGLGDSGGIYWNTMDRRNIFGGRMYTSRGSNSTGIRISSDTKNDKQQQNNHTIKNIKSLSTASTAKIISNKKKEDRGGRSLPRCKSTAFRRGVHSVGGKNTNNINNINNINNMNNMNNINNINNMNNMNNMNNIMNKNINNNNNTYGRKRNREKWRRSPEKGEGEGHRNREREANRKEEIVIPSENSNFGFKPTYFNPSTMHKFKLDADLATAIAKAKFQTGGGYISRGANSKTMGWGNSKTPFPNWERGSECGTTRSNSIRSTRPPYKHPDVNI